jgi:hypothetical protein
MATVAACRQQKKFVPANPANLYQPFVPEPGTQGATMAGSEECEGFTVIGSNFGGGGMPGSDGAGKKVRRFIPRASGCTARLDFDHPALPLGARNA